MDQVKEFKFAGPISSSKSLMNRALIVQSFYENLNVIGESTCDDVSKMRSALLNFKLQEPMDCGAAGTTLRFLMARASRQEGEFFFTGHQRLFERPHQPLIDLLTQLGSKIDLPEKNYMRLVSKAWNIDQPLKVDLSQSSQFASALLLSAWGLEEDLVLELSEDKKSFSYFKMTLDLLQQLGMGIRFENNFITIPKGQKLKAHEIIIEPDMSSCFTMAAFGAACGEVSLQSFPAESIQPDYNFIGLLRSMHVPIEYNSSEKTLRIKKSAQLKALNVDLTNNPDLFPTLVVLLTQAQGMSEITGIDHLVYKESNRIKKTMDLVQSVGGQCYYENKKFTIKGQPDLKLNQSIEFDPDQDHRMAMAAQLFNVMGADIKIKNKSVVNKSFPEFWQIAGVL